jgi:hypothetical protein
MPRSLKKRQVSDHYKLRHEGATKFKASGSELILLSSPHELVIPW